MSPRRCRPRVPVRCDEDGGEAAIEEFGFGPQADGFSLQDGKAITPGNPEPARVILGHAIHLGKWRTIAEGHKIPVTFDEETAIAGAGPESARGVFKQ